MKAGEELVELQVEGMDCNNCALSITRYLEQLGLEDVFVNFQTKEVRYRPGSSRLQSEEIKAGINKLGYTVVDEASAHRRPVWSLQRKLLVSALFTAPLLLGHLLMVVGWHTALMHNGWLQLGLALPVYAIGGWHFGRSALASIRGGVPNMDVLIFMGGTAAMVYSIVGLIIGNPEYYFFETAATIFTLVLLGNWIEQRAVQQTTSAIGELTRLRPETARRITPGGQLKEISVAALRPGMLLQINDGDKVPTDGTVEQGEAVVDESMLTGESLPVSFGVGERLIGGSLLVSGNVQLRVTAAGKDTVLSQMIELVKTAQRDKPKLQRLADRISAVFVPVVVGIAVLTLLVGHFGFGLSFQQALMNAIAVLVISCPCAMGLATPTAVMVGVGRLARNGVLVKGGNTVETFARIENMVFDKTGTLTTGRFRIESIDYPTGEEALANALLYQLEQHSSHPIAQSLVSQLAERVNGLDTRLVDVREDKGIGVRATDASGSLYRVGSDRILPTGAPTDPAQVYLTRDGEVLAKVYLADDLKADAATAMRQLQGQGIRTVLLSGDRAEKTTVVARALGIEEVYAQQLPSQKLDIITQLSQQAPTAMIGDGINDAPALARATLGVSLGNASPAAIESAQLVLLRGQLGDLVQAHAISRATVRTIRQNLFWAFAYNIVAIPIAAVGLLNPMWGAFFMAFSDVVVIGNSVRLRFRRIR